MTGKHALGEMLDKFTLKETAWKIIFTGQIKCCCPRQLCLRCFHLVLNLAGASIPKVLSHDASKIGNTPSPVSSRHTGTKQTLSWTGMNLPTQFLPDPATPKLSAACDETTSTQTLPLLIPLSTSHLSLPGNSATGLS